MSQVTLLSGLGGGPGLWAGVEALLPDIDICVPEVPWAATKTSWAHDPAIMMSFLRSQLAASDVIVAHSFAAVLLFNLLADPDGPPPAPSVILMSIFHRPDTSCFDWAHFNHHLALFPCVMESGLRAEAAGRIPDSLLARMSEIVQDSVGPLGWLRFYEAYAQTSRGDATRLSDVTTLITGAADDAADPGDSRDLHLLIPGSTLLVVPGGHFPMVDAPACIADTILTTFASATV